MNMDIWNKNTNWFQLLEFFTKRRGGFFRSSVRWPETSRSTTWIWTLHSLAAKSPGPCLRCVSFAGEQSVGSWRSNWLVTLSTGIIQKHGIHSNGLGPSFFSTDSFIYCRCWLNWPHGSFQYCPMMSNDLGSDAHCGAKHQMGARCSASCVWVTRYVKLNNWWNMMKPQIENPSTGDLFDKPRGWRPADHWSEPLFGTAARCRPPVATNRSNGNNVRTKGCPTSLLTRR